MPPQQRPRLRLRLGGGHAGAQRRCAVPGSAITCVPRLRAAKGFQGFKVVGVLVGVDQGTLNVVQQLGEQRPVIAGRAGRHACGTNRQQRHGEVEACRLGDDERNTKGAHVICRRTCRLPQHNIHVGSRINRATAFAPFCAVLFASEVQGAAQPRTRKRGGHQLRRAAVDAGRSALEGHQAGHPARVAVHLSGQKGARHLLPLGLWQRYKSGGSNIVN